MSIKRINEFPEGSGSLSSDDIFLFMDDPSNGGVTKKISLSQVAAAIGGGVGVGNANTGDISFNDVQIIGSGTASGDGNGYGTIELVPDNNLYDNHQYVIIDPTGPNHIHLRAGGPQDNSNAEIIVGGERNNVRVNDQSPLARLQTESLVTLNTYYFTSTEFSSVVWETVDGNNRIVINNPTPAVYDAVWAFTSDSIFSVIDDSGNYYELARNGSSTPGGAAPVMVYVVEAPPTNPTTLTQLTFEIKETRQASVEVNGSDVRIEAADDVRIYGRDTFRLYNYSPNDPIEIFTDYDDQEYKWQFTSDGQFVSPNGATIGSLGMGWPGFYNSDSNSPVSLGSNDINSGNSISSVTAQGTSEFGGEVNINVATTGLANYLNWTFNQNGALVFPNNTTVANGTYDNGTGGNNGISLNCAVGYELNWQGGRLKSTYDNGQYTHPLYLDSPLAASSGNFTDLTVNNTKVSLINSSIFELGTISGSNPINFGPDRSFQTMTLNGNAVTFTKGSGWPEASDVSADTVLRIVATSGTSIVWSVVTDWFNQPPAGALSSGTHLFLLRAMGSSVIEGHYIGNKTN